jgi:hypothetical protein
LHKAFGINYPLVRVVVTLAEVIRALVVIVDLLFKRAIVDWKSPFAKYTAANGEVVHGFRGGHWLASAPTLSSKQ